MLAAGVYFGTLLGMADHLSFTLGPAQYNPYKMVPYGPVPEVGQPQRPASPFFLPVRIGIC